MYCMTKKIISFSSVAKSYLKTFQTSLNKLINYLRGKIIKTNYTSFSMRYFTALVDCKKVL
jgi:fructose-1,6-bisphosphatase